MKLLRAEGACIVVDVPDGAPPRLLHYGADLGPDVDLTALDTAVARPTPQASFDVPVHPGLLPLEAEGWLGRPGLAGHRSGRQLLPLLTVDSVTAEEGSGLSIATSDGTAGLAVVSDLVLEPSGVLRVRHTVTNTGDDEIELTALDASIPFPPVVSEVLDLSGRWSHERTPVRGPLGLGTRLRETRRGRTGHDSPLLMVVGVERRPGVRRGAAARGCGSRRRPLARR